MPDVNFVYDGDSYVTDFTFAWTTEHIKLPNGKVLEVTGWSTSMPSTPLQMRKVDSGKLIPFRTPVARIAVV